MQGNDLCLCMDKDKRSLFNASITACYFYKSKNAIFHQRDMSDNLHMLVKKVSNILKIPVVILFQHPSPSSKVSISLAGKSCLLLLSNGHADKIVVVFDFNYGKNCWTYHDLKHTLIGHNHIHRKMTVSHPVLICDIKSNKYSHPLFGTVVRTGWALMKKGDEVAFHITCH